MTVQTATAVVLPDVTGETSPSLRQCAAQSVQCLVLCVLGFSRAQWHEVE